MSSVAVGRGRNRTYEIVDALNVEWRRLARDDREAAPRWGAAHPALAGCRSLHEVLGAAALRTDAILFALLTEHARGDQMAGRVVLQAMLGKIVNLATRHRDGSVDDYVAAVWCRICSYPLNERPAKIAANLALDALKDIHHENAWTRRRIEVACIEPGMLLDQLYIEACARNDDDHNAGMATSTASSVIAIGDRLGLIDPVTRDVLVSVYSDGLTGLAAADRHETSAAMIRFRCSKGVRRLASHADRLIDAA